MLYSGLIHRYHQYLPVKKESIVTLCEGNTPLIPSIRLQKEIGLPGQLYYKFEGLNPTGSFKDRGMTYAVSKAFEKGAKTVVCASTGNTSASAAAYATRANLKCVVLIPEGNIAFGKLAQAIIHGAQVIQIRGNFDAALKMVREIGEKLPIEIVNSINPFRIEGQKTASFEICESLGQAPDYHFLPVGNAGNITAYWKGFKEWFDLKKVSTKPVMMGFQASGAAPIVRGHSIEKPETIASAIKIGNPASWKQALLARDESKGVIDEVTDDEILEAYSLLSNLDGVFCEPASAVSVAGIIKMAKKNFFKKDVVITATLTGHGLKDPDTAIKNNKIKPVSCDPDFDQLVKILEE